MPNYIYYIIIGLLAIWIFSLMKKKPKEETTQTEKIKKISEKKPLPYKKKYLFTKAEYNFYWQLKEIADKYNAVIFSKTRLADIIDITIPKSNKEYYSHLNRIKSKHVDYIICDEKLNLKTVIELDDYTHNRPDRQERDTFLNRALETAGIKIIHITNINEDIEKHLKPILETEKQFI